jgi:hypothetical protein
MTLRNKFTTFILISVLLAGIFGYYYYQKNIYSREVLRVEILGKEEPQALEEFEYLVKYKNNGNIVLESAQLIFQFPEGSLPVNENSPRAIRNLEDIYPGEERNVSFEARLLGREGETKKAEATLRYRPKNLKAFFEAATTFTSRIQSVPLTFGIELPSRIEAGKEIQFFLNYFSNSDWPLSNLRIKIEYPAGFEFISSRPQALEKTEWDLSLLNKAEGGRIEVKGKLSGEVREQKIFRANLGMWREGEFILLKEIVRGTEILRPAISVFQRINGNSDYTANPGDLLHYEIFFRNISQAPFEDLFLVSKLESPAFDFDTMRTESGQFNKGENFILWDWREIPKLKFLQDGEEGKVEFWITLKEEWDTAAQGKDFSLKNQITLSQVRENFETKINSRLEVSQKAYFQDEIFGSSGAMPPRVGETTNYTIVWEVKNYYNDVKNITVKAILPPQIKLTGRIFPEGAPLTYDSISREVVWTLGDIEAGAGIKSSAPSVAFQIAFTPAESQRGQAPLILGEAKIRGEDNWTGVRLEGTDLAIATDQVQ